MKRLRRSRVVRVVDVRDRTVVVTASGDAHQLTGASAQLARAILAFLVAPASREELIAHLSELAGEPLADTAVVDELLALLMRSATLVEASSPPPRPRPLAGTRILLALTGAIATMHAPSMATQLIQRGAELRVAATHTAQRYVSLEALEALTHAPVAVDLHGGPPAAPVPHLEHARWADMVLVWPATATTIERLAGGDYSTLVAAIALSASCPVVLAPSMNAAMYNAPAVQRNVHQLIADGMHVLAPAFGHEVADAPSTRQAVLGPAPPLAVVAQLVEAVLTMHRHQRPMRPDSPEAWDALYAKCAPDDLPWHQTTADTDLLEAIGAGPFDVLDVGTGLGQVARELAGVGHRVVATDVSSHALSKAQATDSRVVWLEDDITQTRLRADFDVVLDRACLHVLPPSRAMDWAAAMLRLVRKGGRLIVKTHDEASAKDANTTAYAWEELSRLLGDHFELVSATPSTLPGPRHAPSGWLWVMQRR